MSNDWIKPERLFDGEDVITDISVRIEDGRIAALSDHDENGKRIHGCLTPGFVDLQVNGGGGVQLNSTPTPDGMAKIAQAHRRFGTVAVMPTVITDHPDVLDQAAEAAIATQGDPGIVGLHIEGPHISLARRGTHSAQYIRPMDQQTLDVVKRLRARDVAVMITLAPEATTTDQITMLAEMGAIVSLGHTDATAEQIEAAIAAGASCATHLFNAMSPMASRAPGAVGAILNADINFGIICDGHHVDDRMIALALRSTHQDMRAFMVSDAMATVGGPDTFQLYGNAVRLEDGRLINTEGNLAGAHVTQAQGVQRVVKDMQRPLSEALKMAVTTPGNLIGKPDLASLVGRSVSDVLVLTDKLDLAGTLSDLHTDPKTLNAAE